MKINSLKILILGYLLAISSLAFSQQYLISQGGTINTCSGTLYDSGGPNGNYGNYENYTITICSNIPGGALTLTFTQFSFESATWDNLTIYDGPNTASNVLINQAGSTALQGVTITATGECLTLRMVTDGSFTYAGFAATISCNFPCQDFSIDLVSTQPSLSPPLDSLWIDVCQNTSATFTLGGTFPNNNTDYEQSDGNLTWNWTVFNETDQAEYSGVGMTSIIHTFTGQGGYHISASAVDINGCTATLEQEIRVRVSLTPSFTGTNIPETPVCPGEEISLVAVVTPTPWEEELQNEVAGVTFLPDGSGVHYETSITNGLFQPGATIHSPNDIVDICVNMEHTYMGDLSMYIECPNGNTMQIFGQGGGGTILGEPVGANLPVDSNTSNLTPGIGYDYCWSPTSTSGTIHQNYNWTYLNSYTDPIGQVSTGVNQLNPGTYQVSGNWSSLVGCPLNGTWTIHITDHMNLDNGYIFSWQINFDASLIPSGTWTIENTIESYEWGGEDIGTGNQDNGSANPITSGTATYTLTVTDDFGCTYSHNVSTTVLPINDPSCCILPDTHAGQDAHVCTNTYTFNASIATGNTGSWEMISGPGTATWTNQNSPHATVLVSEWGVYEFEWTEQYLSPTCVDKDRVTVEFWPIPTTTFTYQPIMCNADHSTITYVGNMTGSATFNWDFDGAAVVNGSGVGPYTIYWTEPGMHSVGLNITENGCSSADTLVNILNPVVLEHSIEVDNDPCFASCGGRAEVFPTGGTEPYTYSWASQNPVLPNLCEGNYTITVTDANNCTTGQNFTVTEPPLLLINDISFNHLICYQSNDGNISITASGGTGDLTYLWSDIGFGTANRTDIAAGEYCVTITDENGCSVTDCVTITQPNELLVTVSPNVAICEESQTVLQAQAMGGTVPYTYMWRYHQDSSFNPGPSTYTVSPDTTRMFEVYVLDAHGCTSNIATIKVTVSPKMIIDTMLIKHNRCYQSCDGRAEIVMHGGLAPLQYSWGSDNHIYSGLCAGIYTVTVTDLIGCSVANNFVIEQPTQLVYSSTVKPATCFGYDDGEANIYVQGGVSPYTYTWPNGHNTETFVGNAGSYTVTVLDDHNCRIVSDFEITQPSKIIVLPMSNKTICKTQSVSLNNQATGGTPYYDFRWEGSDGSVWNSNLYTVSPSTTTTYSLVVTDSHGCKSDRVSTTVYVNPDLVINSVVTSNDTVCPGDPAIIHVDVEGGNGGPYLMTLQDGRVVPSPFTVNPDTTTMYYITLADMCGTPKVVDSILINARPKPKNLFTVESVAGCPPFAAHFTEETPNFGQTYLWNFGDKKYSTEKNPVHIYKEPGVYTVSLEVKDLFGCKFKREIENFITVYQGPIANFETSSQIVSFIDGEIEFINHSSYASNYYWYFGDGDSSLFVNPRHTYKNIGEYQVILVAETDRYCTDTTTRTISVRNEFAFYMPTSFTPNGDGLNDCARPCGNGIDKEDFSLYIYDKWGTPVFETHKFDPDLSCEACSEGAWDGTFRGNKNKGDEIMETGVYYWYAEFKDLYGTVHKKQGQITLVR
ncbi:MAG: PKD domain-containing protein [Bacteroidales bacterium]|nr:PKD domain-containing protein [Bacteroidales bacterium]